MNSQKNSSVSLLKLGEYRYFLPLAVIFITLLISANILSQKFILVGPLRLTVADVFYPLTYVLADSVTEVYGYSYLRKIIWLSFVCNLLVALLLEISILLPPSPDYYEQKEFAKILGHTPQIVVGSLISYVVGEFLNAYVFSKLKILTRGKYLWLRSIGSTTLGQAIDTLIFTEIAFWGVLNTSSMGQLMGSVYLIKLAYAIVSTPFIYGLTSFLKKREVVDTYDVKTHFNPFRLVEEQ